jgi:hypothetical protein
MPGRTDTFNYVIAMFFQNLVHCGDDILFVAGARSAGIYGALTR